jgi:hypothetical protein
VKLLLLLLLALCPLAPAWAHDPILVDLELSVDGSEATVEVALKQSAVLLELHSHRALFADAAALHAAEARIGAWLVAGVTLAAGPSAVPLSYAGCLRADSLEDPITFRLSGRLPAGATALTLVSTLFGELGQGYAIIDNAHCEHGGSGVATIKPGETAAFSLHADASGGTRAVGSFTSFVRMGFLHIMPEGLDHILFVLGLFLLSPALKPLLTQVTAFTIAHSLTLGLSIAGVLALPSRIVEPLIAVSIAFVAIENIVTGTVKPWRWLVVFCFGLVHGLGFAGALKDLHLPKGMILSPLLGFNSGVELGQLCVIAMAAAVTWWCWKRPWYGRVVVVPASLLIAAIGTFWAIQRACGFGIST